MARYLLAVLIGIGVGGYTVHSMDAKLVKQILGGQSLSIRNNVWTAAVERATCQTDLYRSTTFR